MAAVAGSHDPITILGNGDFTAENGVISGSGTVEDPYLIAGWEIDVPSGVPYGVKVENASVSFILRGLVIRGAMEAQGAAIRLGFVSAATIEDCTIANSVNGVEIASSTDIAVRNNVLYVHGVGLRVTGESPSEYRHAIEQSNLLNDLPIHYYYGLDGERIEGIETRHLTVAASRNVTVIGNSVLDGDGIQLAFVTDSTVTANIAGRDNNVPTEHAIHLYESERNVVTANLIKNTRLAGIQLTLSSDNEITGNTLLVNDTGIRLIGATGNLVSENDLRGCFTAIWLTGASQDNRIDGNIVVGKVSADGDRRQGIVLDLASGNRIERNGLTECEMGVTLEAQATSNQIVDNTIVAGAYGIFISGSYNEIAQNLFSQNTRGILFPETFGEQTARGNTLHDNVFSENGHHLYLNHDSEGTRCYRNVFLEGGTSLVSDYGHTTWTVSGEGNFWEDYDGCDADGDGFGDDPVLVLPAGVNDTAPLLSPIGAIGGLGVLSTLEETVFAVLTEGGDKVQIAVLIADEGYERFVGFRGFPTLLQEDFPGILFDYGEEVPGGVTGYGFTMETVNFPLDIAFFDGSGAFVGGTAMEANSSTQYTVNASFQYALELQSGSLSAWGIGAGSRLILPEPGEE